MTTGVNRVVLVGRLTRDPEVKYTGGGTAVLEMSVALNSRERVDDEWQDRVDFFDVTVWGEQAEACGQHLSRGSLVGVDGRLRQDRWETKDDPPKKRSKVGVVAQTVQFLDSRPRDVEAPAPAATDAADDDSIPF